MPKFKLNFNTRAACKASLAFVKNAMKHGRVFRLVNKVYPRLPREAQQRITQLSSREMNEQDANDVLTIVSRYFCVECGKANGKCKHTVGATHASPLQNE
jgi:hypothetical protein